MSSKWCPVAYNFLEVIAPYGQAPETTAAGSPYFSRSASVRIAELLRSLIILLVGPKPYRHLRDIHHLAQMVERVRSICGSDAQTQSSPVGKHLISSTSDSLSDPSLFTLARSEELQVTETLMLTEKMQLSFESECSIVRFSVYYMLWLAACSYLRNAVVQRITNAFGLHGWCRVLSPYLTLLRFIMQEKHTATSCDLKMTRFLSPFPLTVEKKLI
ncbi:unnamed protein product [Dibothriocephalus latus]|uniref:Uncharacterized protein n=1 Tax=Dibothriocephalus latus TaxID=60516 RepID=A0A3P7LXW7_DIBLA|nr:unnamed protein product [Dibothriocephalus latus]